MLTPSTALQGCRAAGERAAPVPHSSWYCLRRARCPDFREAQRACHCAHSASQHAAPQLRGCFCVKAARMSSYPVFPSSSSFGCPAPALRSGVPLQLFARIPLTFAPFPLSLPCTSVSPWKIEPRSSPVTHQCFKRHAGEAWESAARVCAAAAAGSHRQSLGQQLKPGAARKSAPCLLLHL